METLFTPKYLARGAADLKRIAELNLKIDLLIEGRRKFYGLTTDLQNVASKQTVLQSSHGGSFHFRFPGEQAGGAAASGSSSWKDCLIDPARS